VGAVVFGVLSALIWGSGDFCGGLATRRAPLLAVLVASQAVGLAALVLLALLWGEPWLSPGSLAWSAAAGLAGTVGLGALYTGLARGAAAVVAPVSGVLAAALPVIAAALESGLPGAGKLVGFAVALAGIWLVSRTGAAQDGRSGLAFGLLAGFGFGSFFILVHRAGGESTFWPLAVARAVALLVLLPALLRPPGAGQLRRVPAAAVGSGLLDTGGNICFVLAGQLGRLDVASVLASLYPAATVLLARLVLHEHISRAQQLGLLLTLGAIALIAG
jgi:drug/metabolite transporter (DMT)-like permease